MSNRETYDVVDAKGVVKEYAVGMRPITASSRRLDKDGTEVHSGHMVVNPLHKMPSVKQMIDQMNRSGELAMRMRAAENLQLAEDGDPAFEGYNRQWLEDNFISEFEADYIYSHLQPTEPPEAPQGSPAPTTLPEGAPQPSPASPEGAA